MNRAVLLVVHLVHLVHFAARNAKNPDEMGENGMIEHTAALCAGKPSWGRHAAPGRPLCAGWKRREEWPVADLGLENLLRGLLLRGLLSGTDYGRKRSSRVTSLVTMLLWVPDARPKAVTSVSCSDRRLSACSWKAASFCLRFCS